MVAARGWVRSGWTGSASAGSTSALNAEFAEDAEDAEKVSRGLRRARVPLADVPPAAQRPKTPALRNSGRSENSSQRSPRPLRTLRFKRTPNHTRYRFSAAESEVINRTRNITEFARSRIRSHFCVLSRLDAFARGRRGGIQCPRWRSFGLSRPGETPCEPGYTPCSPDYFSVNGTIEPAWSANVKHAPARKPKVRSYQWQYLGLSPLRSLRGRTGDPGARRRQITRATVDP
jgi:hypothetical protein